jgi:uncharacterized coiled-coil DUF342 family protein
VNHTSMNRTATRSIATLASVLLTMLSALPAHAQTQADRERQQMMQLQQQLQKLRQENAQLQQGKAQELDKAKADAEQVRREAGQLRASSAGSQRELKRLREELDKATQALAQNQAELEKLKSDSAQRDTAQQAALQAAQQTAAQQLATERRVAESAATVLGARLKTNTARADVCEEKHEKAMTLAKEVLDRYEARQLRACEPFTGLWRVHEEKEIEALRDRLFESRLDVSEANAGSPNLETK